MGCFDVGCPGTPRDSPTHTPTPGPPVDHAFSGDGEEALRALEADPSAFGPDAAAFAVSESIDNAYVRVGVRHADAHWTRFLALRPPLPGPPSGPFATLRDWRDRDPDVDRYAAALAARLPQWPWAQGTPEFRWGLAGATTPPIGIARIWAALALVAASVAFGVWVVLAMGRRETQAPEGGDANPRSV